MQRNLDLPSPHGCHAGIRVATQRADRHSCIALSVIDCHNLPGGIGLLQLFPSGR